MKRSYSIISQCILGLGLCGAFLLYQSERQLNLSLAEHNQYLEGQLKRAQTSKTTASKVVQPNEFELQTAQKDHEELLRLRNEVGQLHHDQTIQSALEEEAIAVSATSPSQFKRINPMPPGTYITKEQLSFAGFSTPEAALQSVEFARTKGTYEMMVYGTVDQRPANDSGTVEVGQKIPFKVNHALGLARNYALQILARKVISNDTVDLRIKVDAEPIAGINSTMEMKPLRIVRVTRLGNEWKVVSKYDGPWVEDPSVVNFVQ